MGRRPKLYVPLTVTFFEDDRIIEAGDGPTLLYLSMCCKCKAMGSDGRLKERQIARLHRPKWKVELHRLAELELVLFDESVGEWFVAGWFSHNDPIAAVEAKRAADRARKAAADSNRIPDGFHADSTPKGSRGKGREEGKPPHRYAENGSGACAECSLPPANQIHLKLIDGGQAG